MHGGRIASLVVDGQELLVTHDEPSVEGNPARWGWYPLVPWGGRVAGATFSFGERTIELDANDGPNAIHGTGYVTPWDVLDEGREHCELQCSLDWPFGGSAHQHLQLTPFGIVCVLTVVAGDVAMPAVIGWHPWFRKPLDDQLRFDAMYERGEGKLPTGRIVAPVDRPWDHCFVGPLAPLQLRYPGLVLTISSDADHWVVYDEERVATCVEPQSGPPDAFHIGGAAVVAPGELLQRRMTVSWTGGDPAG